MLTNINLIHARAAIQVEIEEAVPWDYAIETVAIVYELSCGELEQVLESLKDSHWYIDRVERGLA